MSKFVVIYRSPATEDVLLDADARSRAEAETRAWMAWAEDVGEHLIDRGAPLDSPHVVTHTGVATAIIAGSATGYSLLEAVSMEQATTLMRKHPHLVTAGATIEVYAALPWPDAV